MKPLYNFSEFSVYQLTPELAAQYSAEICTALDQIPMVDTHTKEKLLAATKGDRVLYGKWQHSLIALDQSNNFGGLIVGYERKSEGNHQYPQNTMYLNDFAVAAEHQKKGLGKFLVQAWLEFNSEKGLSELGGELHFSVQTNGAEWNSHVQKLYESFGFKKIAEKEYDNRTDNIYALVPESK